MYYTSDFVKEYFNSLKYKRDLINKRNMTKLKNESFIHLNGYSEANKTSEINLSIFEKLIYPFLFVYVNILNFIESILWEHDFLTVFICVVIFVTLVLSSIGVLIYNNQAVSKIYYKGISNEVNKFYEEKEYPIFHININTDSSGYQIHYSKNDNSFNKANVSKFYVDDNLKSLNEKSIGNIVFYDYNNFLNYVENTNLNELNLSSDFISKMDKVINNPTNRNQVVKSVKLLEIPNF